MRGECEIEREIERCEGKMKDSYNEQWISLNARRWALRWVLNKED